MRPLRPARWLASLAIAASGLLSAKLSSAETVSPEQAVRLAAAQNPTLKAALLDVAAARQATHGEENARVPTLTLAATGNYSEGLGADARSDSEGVLGSAALGYTTDIGTLIEAGIESNVGWRNVNAFGTNGAALGATTSSDVYLSVRQPLLRGAGEDAVLASLAQARASQTQAERERDQTASKTALEVLSAYWDLWYAERAVAVQEQALKLAQKQLADAEAREATLGTGSKIDVLQFASSAAAIEDALSTARTTRDTRAIALGKSLGMAPAEAVGLRAANAPPTTTNAGKPKRESSLAERSPELLGMRAQLTAAEARIDSADDAAQVKLDVFGKVSVGAVWADDSYSGLALPGGRPAFTILGGVELELPLGESRAQSEAARARTQRDALEQRYQAASDALEAEVGSLEVELGAADRQVALAQKTATISAQLAEAERQRLELGTGSPSDVVKAEQAAREAELKRLKTVVARATTELSFEHSSGALLERFGSLFGRSS